MNDDHERRRPFLLVPTIPSMNARVIKFDMRRERPLFVGWVGADGNVVSMSRPRPVPVLIKDSPREDEWI